MIENKDNYNYKVSHHLVKGCDHKSNTNQVMTRINCNPNMISIYLVIDKSLKTSHISIKDQK